MSTHNPSSYLIVFFLILLVLVIFSIPLGVLLGIGYLLSLLLPLTFFQSTVIVIGNVLLIILFIAITAFHYRLSNIENWLIDVEDEDEDE